jgi:hypothetical protein
MYVMFCGSDSNIRPEGMFRMGGNEACRTTNTCYIILLAYSIIFKMVVMEINVTLSVSYSSNSSL